VEQRLSQRDNDFLDVVAGKIIDQQAAAAGVISAISVTMPEHGKELRFFRQIQIDPQGELYVTFRAGGGWWAGVLNALWPSALLLIFFRVALIRRCAAR